MPKNLHISVHKFYLLEYFYIFLKSAQKFQDQNKIFEQFKILKQDHLLGESKYKKLNITDEDLSPTQLNRYSYTFQEVFIESYGYNLVSCQSYNVC